MAYETDERDILTVDADDDLNGSVSASERVWHELQNANFSKRILHGNISAVEVTPSSCNVIVNYKGYRVVIPSFEMELGLQDDSSRKSMHTREVQVLNNMIFSEIDFIIMGLDGNERKAVGSRKQAMLAKRKQFFFPNQDGETMVKEGQVVECRILAVSPKAVRVEVFGVECRIHAKFLAWEWVGNAQDQFFIGDKMLVKLTSVITDPETWDVKIEADVRPVLKNEVLDALRKIKVNGRYVGVITDVHKGVCYLRLDMGANAIAHHCKDRRLPGKDDTVSFIATRLDEQGGVAIGFISRILRQHI